MEYFIGWVFFAALVGLIGTNRTIGFLGSFLWSILLSPIIGLIITLCYETNDSQKRRIYAVREAQKQTAILQQMAVQKSQSDQENMSEELAKWKKQMDDGIITAEEYQKIRNKIISRFD